jgi:hypothetical protein
MHEGELLTIVNSWNLAQVNEYIERLELRVANTQQLIKELKKIRRHKSRKVVYDNGPRDNR